MLLFEFHCSYGIKNGEEKTYRRAPSRPFLSLARRSAVYPSLRAIRLRCGHSRDFLLFVSFRSAAAVVAHHHPPSADRRRSYLSICNSLKARDNKGSR